MNPNVIPALFHPSHPQRLDIDRMIDLIDKDASVLDLGCGNGALLVKLAERGHKEIAGVELEEDAVISCVK